MHPYLTLLEKLRAESSGYFLSQSGTLWQDYDRHFVIYTLANST